MASKYKKRADGRYLIQILLGYSNGKAKYKNVYAHTIPELEKKAAKIRDEIEKGISVKDERMTVETWALQWLKLYKVNIEYNTYIMYETNINVHIIPSIGIIRLKELKSHHIQEMLNKLVAEGKERTAEIVYTTLNQILGQAVKNDYIYKNVINNVTLKKRSKPIKRALSDSEIENIRKADLPLKEKTLLILLLTTGLRKGEALALTKKDVNLNDKYIEVNKSAIIKKNQMEIKNSPKSDAGFRKVPITDELFILLSQHIPQLKGIYVFPTTKDNFMTHSAFRRMWEKTLNTLNITAGGSNGVNKINAIATDITPHIFRHTYATLLYRANVDIKTAQYLLGHSSLQMTMETYTHLDESKKDEQIGKFNTFMNTTIQSKISQQESKLV